jgi:GNAT superfamily N-acetyltransferase
MRSLRLRALAEVPTAYGSTLAEEQANSDDVWRERTIGASSGCDRATFIAECEGMWLATVTGLAKRFGSTNGVPMLVAMFVLASARRQGIGVGLVDIVSSWAREGGANQLALWVESGNGPAVALYQRCDFRFTGEEQPLAHTPTLIERQMVRQL